jgi:hypothetical protein
MGHGHHACLGAYARDVVPTNRNVCITAFFFAIGFSPPISVMVVGA